MGLKDKVVLLQWLRGRRTTEVRDRKGLLLTRSYFLVYLDHIDNKDGEP
jgi:hypothetical protein